MRRNMIILSMVLALSTMAVSGALAAPTGQTPVAQSSQSRRFIHFLRPPHAAGAGVGFVTGPMTYHQGRVKTNPVAYLIFWGSFWQGTQGTTDRGIIVAMFQDIGTTRYANIMSQYYQTRNGPTEYVANTNTLGGTYVDTTHTIPTSATSCGSNTVQDGDINNEITTAIATEGWPASGSSAADNATYLVFTPSQVEINGLGTCSNNFCGYHTYGLLGAQVDYAVLPYPDVNAFCVVNQNPHGDANADALSDFAAHEDFESITDPGGGGWFVGNDSLANTEMGDLCYTTFPSGSTPLNNGGAYYLQTMFSNATQQCVSGYAPQTAGIYRPSNSTFYLRNHNATGVADLQVTFGTTGDIPVEGDWTGQGYDTIGVYRPSTSTFYLSNSNTTGHADIIAAFGAPGDIPVVGDWTGQGKDTIGVYRPSTAAFYLRQSNTTGSADIIAAFGAGTDTPLVGDWDGNGTDTVGVYRPSTHTFYLRNNNTTGGADISLHYGGAGDLPLVGDWTSQGKDTIGIFRPSTHTFYLRNTNTTGTADITFSYGTPTDLPQRGMWLNAGSGGPSTWP